MREAGIASEIYPDQSKMKKQFDYAVKKGIQYLIIVGENEIEENIVSVKNLIKGEQVKVPKNELVEYFLGKK